MWLILALGAEGACDVISGILVSLTPSSLTSPRL